MPLESDGGGEQKACDESENEERLEAREVKVRRGDELETYGGLDESASD